MPTATLLQLVETRDTTGASTLDALPNPAGLSPLNFERTTPEARVPRIGSVGLAAFALESGLTVRSFQLSDRYGQLLDDEELERLSDALLDALQVSERTARRLLNHELRGVTVRGAELYSTELSQLSVRMYGAIFSANGKPAVDFVRKAWARLRPA